MTSAKDKQMKIKLVSNGHLNFEYKRFNLVTVDGRQVEWESRTHKLRALAMSISSELAQKTFYTPSKKWSSK